MLQSLTNRGPLAGALSKKTIIGQSTQVRNHVKMYPWRQNRSNTECYLDTTKTPYTDRFNINEFRPSKNQRKPWMKVIPKEKDGQYNVYKWNDAYRSDPIEAKQIAAEKLRRFQDSLMQRGYARERPTYEPPPNVEETIIAFFREYELNDGITQAPVTDEDVLEYDIDQNRTFKFNIINKCINEFKHDLPNSYLNDIQKVRDLIDYYSTPICGVNPYTSMLRKEDSLPANLALIAEPLRFNKESDTMFKGHTAFPGMVNKIPGLRAAKKYPILNQDEFQWPDI